MANINVEQIPEQLMACMMNTEKYTAGLNIVSLSTLELLRYYVSVLNGCAYCVDMHAKEALAAGETELRLNLVPYWQDTELFSEQEQALLAWTEAVTNISASSRRQLKTKFNDLCRFFSIAEVANLTLAIVQINAWTRLAKPFAFEAGTYQVGQY